MCPLSSENVFSCRVGSPLYMAPEVLFKESGGYDGKADLWRSPSLARMCFLGYNVFPWLQCVSLAAMCFLGYNVFPEVFSFPI